MSKNYRGKPQKTEKAHRTNGEIRVPNVRVVNDGEGFSQGVYKTSEALQIAENLGLDLIEVNGKPKPAICRIEEYGKYLYNEKKRQKELKKTQKKVVTKTLRFTSNTNDHDIEVAANKAIEFLKEGNFVRGDLIFKGRSISFEERGTKVLLKFAQLLEDYGIPESMPEMQGKNSRKMLITIKPKK